MACDKQDYEGYKLKENQKRIMGPVDYLVVGFPGNKFNGKIAPEIADLQKKGIIRVIDLVLVTKDASGNLTINEVKDSEDEASKAFAEILENTAEWFSEGDIKVIMESLPNNSSVGLLLFENTWAIRFKEALIESDAELIDMGRIPTENIMKVEKKLMVEGGA